MEPIAKHTGIVAPMDRVNVDTDQIIPKQFLKRIERTGFGQFLFFDWRFNSDGSLNPDFELNRHEYRGASILAAGRNFGSGSSREHAPWALLDYGFRCILAVSFADIFHRNCLENGIVPALVPEKHMQLILDTASAVPGWELTVDLEKCRIRDDRGLDIPFVVHEDPATHEFRRHCLLNGLDDISLTLQHEDKIAVFESRRSKHGGILTA